MDRFADLSGPSLEQPAKNLRVLRSFLSQWCGHISDGRTNSRLSRILCRKISSAATTAARHGSDRSHAHRQWLRRKYARKGSFRNAAIRLCCRMQRCFLEAIHSGNRRTIALQRRRSALEPGCEPGNLPGETHHRSGRRKVRVRLRLLCRGARAIMHARLSSRALDGTALLFRVIPHRLDGPDTFLGSVSSLLPAQPRGIDPARHRPAIFARLVAIHALVDVAVARRLAAGICTRYATATWTGKSRNRQRLLRSLSRRKNYRKTRAYQGIQRSRYRTRQRRHS